MKQTRTALSDDNWSVLLRRSSDVASARKLATHAMTMIEASATKKTKFVTAVSEVARNAIIHGGGGLIDFRIGGAGARRKVIAQCSDKGPGIEDIDLALRDGYTSKKGLGLGLGGARRLVDHFEIRPAASQGTVVIMESFAR